MGVECDVYRIGRGIVYKHYPEYKLLHSKIVTPKHWIQLQSIQSKVVEVVLEHDDEGFVTHENDGVLGNNIIYHDHPAAKQTCQSRLIVSHNDLIPCNLMYNRRQDRVIIIDWTKINGEPQYDYLNDQIRLQRWKEILGTGESKWFPDITQQMVRDSLERDVLFHAYKHRIFDHDRLSEIYDNAAKRTCDCYGDLPYIQDLKYGKRGIVTEAMNVTDVWKENIRMQDKIMS